jgi:N-acetyl-gamma-glutamyl-phosphate reductase
MSGSERQSGIPVAILGGTGYVSGELLRLLAGHPVFRVAAIASTSRPGGLVAEAFPHLAGSIPDSMGFVSVEDLLEQVGEGAIRGVFAGTPHGTTAALVSMVLDRAKTAGAPIRIVDLSADFRFGSHREWEAVYGQAHGAPERIAEFVGNVPELHRGARPAHAAQPGCFTTAVTLAAAPFAAVGEIAGPIFASAITGSSGSGRTPGQGTHHPERRSALHAYTPLRHRHEPEMRALLGALAKRLVDVEFVPQSGPFVRGIHATVRLETTLSTDVKTWVDTARIFYSGCPFVTVSEEPARMSDVVGTNRCILGIASRGKTVVVTSVLDNLTKGAAGGAVQWMNRLNGLDETTGLRLPGLGWF